MSLHRAEPTDHGKSAGSFPAAASSPRDAPATPAARTPARASRRATPASAPARCARRSAAAAAPARRADARYICTAVPAPPDRAPTPTRWRADHLRSVRVLRTHAAELEQRAIVSLDTNHRPQKSRRFSDGARRPAPIGDLDVVRSQKNGPRNKISAAMSVAHVSVMPIQRRTRRPGCSGSSPGAGRARCPSGRPHLAVPLSRRLPWLCARRPGLVKTANRAA